MAYVSVKGGEKAITHPTSGWPRIAAAIRASASWTSHRCANSCRWPSTG